MRTNVKIKQKGKCGFCAAFRNNRHCLAFFFFLNQEARGKKKKKKRWKKCASAKPAGVAFKKNLFFSHCLEERLHDQFSFLSISCQFFFFFGGGSFLFVFSSPQHTPAIFPLNSNNCNPQNKKSREKYMKV